MPELLVDAKAAIVRGAASFADVPPTHPFYTEIANIGARQITVGCGFGNYCPDAGVSREQMATFPVRAFGL